MNINRLNYENYFLLYVDGELSATEMQAVDHFAAENKDLADELNMLLQTKLPEEAFHFENKSSLLRTTSEIINSINCEEKFLLFIDNELTEQEKAETLHFVAAQSANQDLFETIKQTKLPLENIVFPDKESLYRKEEHKKPIIVLQWWKLAVAAALIGIMAIIGIFVPLNRPSSSEVKTNNRKIPNKLNKSLIEHSNLLQNKIDDPTHFDQNKNLVTTKPKTIIKEKNKLELAVLIEPLVKNAEKTKHIEEGETIALNTNNSHFSNDMPIINAESNNHASLLKLNNNHSEDAVNPNYVKTAVYKELDTDDERKSLYVGSVEINKDKLRGFLRKASSLFKVRNKTEEEKTEISNSHTLE